MADQKFTVGELRKLAKKVYGKGVVHVELYEVWQAMASSPWGEGDVPYRPQQWVEVNAPTKKLAIEACMAALKVIEKSNG